MAAVLIFLPVLILLGMRYFGVPRIVEYYILNKLRPALGENADLASVDLSWNSLTLRELVLTYPESGIDVSAKEVRLNLQYFNLLVYGLSLVNIVDEVQIDNWLVRHDSSKVIPKEPSQEAKRTIWEAARGFPSVKRVNFSGGGIIYPPFEFKNIYGWANSTTRDSLRFDFSSGALGDTVNLRLSGSANLAEESLEADAVLDGTDIPADLNISERMEFQGGRLSASLNMRLAGGKTKLAGNLQIDDAAFIYDRKWDAWDGSFQAAVEDTVVRFEARLRLLGQETFGAGEVYILKEPSLNLGLKIPRLELREALSRFSPSLEIAGNCQTELKLKGSFTEPEIEFRVSSKRVSYSNTDFEDLQLDGSLENGVVKLNTLRCSAVGGELESSGELKIDGGKTRIDLFSRYLGKPALDSILPQAGSVPLEELELTAKAQGLLKDPSISGSYRARLFPFLKELQGQLSYQGLKLTLSEHSGAGDSLKGSLDFSLGQPKFTFFGDNLHRLVTDNKLPGIFSGDEILTGVGAAGSPADFNLSLKAEKPGLRFTVGSRFTGGEDLQNLGSYSVVFHDSVRIGGDLAFRLQGDTLQLDNFTLGDYVQAWGNYLLEEGRLSDFNLKAEYLPLDSVLLFVGFDGWDRYQGKAKLDVKAEGMLKALNVEMGGYLSEMSLFGLPGYWANVAGNLKNREFRLLSFDFGNVERRLFSGAGDLNLDTQRFRFESRMQNIDSERLMNSIVGGKKILTGSADWRIKGSGTLTSPQLEASLIVEQGALLRVPFDDMEASLSLSRDESSPLKIDISRFRLRKRDQYSMGIRGEIPLSVNEMELIFDAQGRLLKILPGVERFITYADGIGTAEATLRGTLKAPRLSSARVSMQDGTMRLKSVVDEITDIKLEAALEGDFINISRLSGEIDNVPFTITTMPQVTTSEGPLQPWVIGKTGLSLGIITLSTGEGGLPLNLPTFIKAGETARLKPAGKSPGESAYIAGPEEHPVVRGKLLVRDGVVVYPPPGKKDDGTPKREKLITRLLKKINWDLEVIPDRGNTYNREMSGFLGADFLQNFPIVLDRVVIDCNVDRQVDGLRLRGSINDNSLTMGGKFKSTRGTVEFLDLDFQVQEFTVEFDPTQRLPMVEGYATTTYRDTLDRSVEIILRAAHRDTETGAVTYRSQWGDFTFVLENETGDSQEQILGYLGYTPETIGGRVTDISFRAVNQAVFGAWLRKLSREMRNVLGLDYLDINPAMAQNLLEERLSDPSGADTLSTDWRARYFRRSEFTAGKYITDDLFFTYSGRFETGISSYEEDPRLGIIHTWNLEYRIPAQGANMLMIFSYEYDNLIRREDRSISVKYTFNF